MKSHSSNSCSVQYTFGCLWLVVLGDESMQSWPPCPSVVPHLTVRHKRTQKPSSISLVTTFVHDTLPGTILLYQSHVSGRGGNDPQWGSVALTQVLVMGRQQHLCWVVWGTLVSCLNHRLPCYEREEIVHGILSWFLWGPAVFTSSITHKTPVMGDCYLKWKQNSPLCFHSKMGGPLPSSTFPKKVGVDLTAPLLCSVFAC